MTQQHQHEQQYHGSEWDTLQSNIWERLDRLHNNFHSLSDDVRIALYVSGMLIALVLVISMIRRLTRRRFHPSSPRTPSVRETTDDESTNDHPEEEVELRRRRIVSKTSVNASKKGNKSNFFANDDSFDGTLQAIINKAQMMYDKEQKEIQTRASQLEKEQEEIGEEAHEELEDEDEDEIKLYESEEDEVKGNKKVKEDKKIKEEIKLKKDNKTKEKEEKKQKKNVATSVEQLIEDDDDDDIAVRQPKKSVLEIVSIDMKTRHVVVKNTSSLPVDLNNWRIKNCTYQLAQNFPAVTLPAKGTFTFTPRKAGNPSKYTSYWQSGDRISLHYGEFGKDALIWLYDPSGVVVHHLSTKK